MTTELKQKILTEALSIFKDLGETELVSLFLSRSKAIGDKLKSRESSVLNSKAI